MHGQITAPQHNYAGGALEPEKRMSNAKHLPINVYARLTPDELEELKHYINVWGLRLPQYRPLKNIDTSLTIEEWFMTRDKTSPEPRSAADLAEEYFGSRNKTNKVYDTIRNLRELRQKRFEKRGKR